MSEKCKFFSPDEVYYTTTTVVGWVDLFTKLNYCNIIIESLKYCQKNKGLTIHAWVIMSNHIHMIISGNENNSLSDIMRDFKRFTSVELAKEIIVSNDSRKNWMLNIFSNTAIIINRVNKYKIWQDGNHPIELNSNDKIDKRLDYIHNNPVKAGFVFKPEDYIYSSAIDYIDGTGLLKVELIDL